MVQTASKLLGLVPVVVCERDMDMTEVVQLYCSDMPSPELFTRAYEMEDQVPSQGSV